jgi:osmotically-inducible protein OsmY
MKIRKMIQTGIGAALALVLVTSAFASGYPGRSAQNTLDEKVQQATVTELQKHQKFNGVSATSDDGIVTLAGTVDLYIDKMNAEKKVRKIKTVDGVRNHIQVAGKDVPDSELQDKLANKLRYDRVGQGIVFNSLTLGVENGVVTVGGNVRDYPDRDSALAIVQTTPGVKDVVDEINVAPLSAFDDELRVRLAMAIYGQPALQKYAIDPQAPIRVVVINGHVELAGVVQNPVDRQLAYVQASSVPGVFSVNNQLMVATN